MSRYIDADALIMALRLEYPMMPMFKESRKEWEEKTEGYRKAEEIINDAPTIDAVSVVHGEWKEKETFSVADDDPIIERWQSARCSMCERYHTTPYMYYFNNYNFCPNCGARMKGADDDTR